MRNKNWKKLQSKVNKSVKAINKNIYDDDLWLGRFYIKQIKSEYCEFEDKTTPATHHIKHTDDYFCDDCWAGSGEKLYNRLAYGSSSNSNSYSDYSDDYSDDYSSDYSSGGYSSGNEIDAKVCAEKYVRDNLKAPSTASMCKFSEMNATNTGGNQWNITGYVDAQNSFGATIRSYWIVTLTLTSSGFTDASVVFVDQ